MDKEKLTAWCNNSQEINYRIPDMDALILFSILPDENSIYFRTISGKFQEL